MTTLNQSNHTAILREAESAIRIQRNTLGGIAKREDPDAFLGRLLGLLKGAHVPEGGLKPFTVILDWDKEWEELKEEGEDRDDAVTIHVWAEDPSHASDLAEKMRDAYFEEAAPYLNFVMIQRGHNAMVGPDD